VLLRVSSGEVWDDVVKFAVEREYWGVENLSRIPGQAGSVPVQNVGAYGVEAKDVVVSVEVFDRVDNSVKMILSEDCGFAYRTSIFNTTHKGRYIILSMMLKLSKLPNPKLGYPDVIKRFDIHAHPSLNEIRQAIIEIRDGKFPFPAESIEGNAGSFFKNPLLTEHEFLALEKMFEQNTPNALDKLRSIRNRFPLADGVKIHGAFILEACELKGFAFGQAMLNPAQPVVVLNKTGNARALDVLSLVREVRRIVRERTGLHLITEPELIGFSETELRYYGFNEVEIERYIHQPT
jgi:UDP-N-acetylmuramate dehydrogenase